MLRARGEEVVGVDSGSPAGAEGLRALGVEVHLDGDGVGLVDRVRCVVKSPGVPRDAPVIAAARERGVGGRSASSSSPGGCSRTPSSPSPERTARPRWPSCSGTCGGPPASPSPWPGTSAPRSLAGRRDRRPTRRSSASARASSSRTRAPSRPSAPSLLNVAPDHLDRHGDARELPRAKLRIFANQDDDDVAVYNGADPELAASTLGGRGPQARLRRRRRRGRRSRCAASTTPQRMAAAAAALAMGIEPRRGRRRRCASFAGVPHRLERVARGRRRPLRQRLQGDQRRRGRGGDRVLRRRRARDPRRQLEGRVVRAAWPSRSPSAASPAT